jgi:1,4-alpha-glucan branching enzyme
VLAWLRFSGGRRAPPVAVISNFTPVPRPRVTGLACLLPVVGAKSSTQMRGVYGGSSQGNGGWLHATATSQAMASTRPPSLMLPPLATIYLRHTNLSDTAENRTR